MYTVHQAITDSIKFNPSDSRNRIIRRAAYYIKINKPRVKVKVYYDSPDYPWWHGGFISTGLIDYRGRMFGEMLKQVWTDKEQVKALKEVRKILKGISIDRFD